jgi:hypothetical protein
LEHHLRSCSNSDIVSVSPTGGSVPSGLPKAEPKTYGLATGKDLNVVSVNSNIISKNPKGGTVPSGI